MGDRSAAGEDEAETEASVEPPEADCIPRDEDPPRPDRQGMGFQIGSRMILGRLE